VSPGPSRRGARDDRALATADAAGRAQALAAARGRLAAARVDRLVGSTRGLAARRVTKRVLRAWPVARIVALAAAVVMVTTGSDACACGGRGGPALVWRRSHGRVLRADGPRPHPAAATRSRTSVARPRRSSARRRPGRAVCRARRRPARTSGSGRAGARSGGRHMRGCERDSPARGRLPHGAGNERHSQSARLMASSG
jgi:hypothetical protein